MDWLGLITLVVWLVWIVGYMTSHRSRIQRLEDKVTQLNINMDKLLDSQRNDRVRIHQLERELDV
ncbi:hypothetical protein STG2_156 [Salmonella phage STG2]|uniref:Uncharacterized protein n=1 Tax=Salmonella phage STG2 TaxID=2480623 RepID=A0A3G2KAX3_9CAUD|nr:hypothetical protein HOU44_gp079 [Salmonella phage STG2]AYN56120.1 hypothetical protein STG2_156 [Salmonella phage STG2]